MTDEKKLTQGYNKMMERVRAYYASSGSRNVLEEAIAFATEKAITKDELSAEEAAKVAKYVERDIHEAAEFLVETDKNLEDWFKFDIQLVEERLWELFSSVADQTQLQLRELEERAKLMSEYHTGEVTGPATLQCNQCRKLINLHEPKRIPPCPSCKETVFTRYSFDDEE